MQPQKADGNEKLNVERIENDFYITADHAMERTLYRICGTADRGQYPIKRQYPEWGLQVRIRFGHGRLL